MTRTERSTRRTADTPRKGMRRRSRPDTRAADPVPSALESSRATRRAFLRVLALAGTALAANAATSLATTTSSTKRRATPKSGPTAAMRKEIENQKGSLAKQLKVIRDFALPVGSEPGFGFRPLSPRRRPGGK